MAETSELHVNGEARVVKADPDTPLMYALRNDLDLKSVRFGCGANQCGACFVLVDGEVTASCDTPVWFCDGKEVETLESLGGDSPLQRAFLEEQAGQCGYCLSGILMSAHALLRRNPDPTDAEIRAGLDRNLCRCGAHNRIVRAVLRAAPAYRAGA
jgi:nicotinate dehydrogenase subunit A